jgi:redox-sensitive bicupin YhaK (pirin superfamily)
METPSTTGRDTASLGGLKSRDVKRVDSPKFNERSAIHRARVLIEPGNWAESDPFLLMAEDWYGRGAFDSHPHRGFETVTYVIEGTSSHFDNRGNKGLIGAGEALWLTAGRGIVHNEIPVDDKLIHTLQLWVNLPRADKLVEASYQDLTDGRTPKRKLPGAEAIVFSGASGEVAAPTRNHAKITMVEVRLEPQSSFEQELPADYNGFVVVLEGEGVIGAQSTRLREGQVAWLRHEAGESKVRVESSDSRFRIIIFAGRPLREPVAAQGPFVMNTMEEIQQTYAEYRRDRDKFGLGKRL